MRTETKRNSSYELVKVLAIICIVFCHSIPTERIEYHYATSDPWLFLVIMFRQLGSVGNAIFMVASTWFLVDSDKMNLRKIKQMISDNQLISIICLASMWKEYRPSLQITVKQFFPFLFGTLWYITCYVLYYCLHGFVNRGLRGVKINPKIPLFIILFLDILICILGGFYFNELIGFIMIHVFTWYLKMTMMDKSESKAYGLGKKFLVIGLLGWLIGAFVFNLIGVKYAFIGNKFQNWNRFYNPFILAIAYGLMMMASRKKYQSDVVNKLSGLSLFIYMFTGNQLLRTYPDNILYDFVVAKFGASMLICAMFVVIYSLIKLIIGIGVSILYKKTLGRLTELVTPKECNWIGDKLAKIK